jgi:hypothetical protein
MFIQGVESAKLKEQYNFFKSRLHCTAKYCGSQSKAKSNEDIVKYVQNSTVSDSIGKAFQLQVVGFSISENTIAADVKLTDEKTFAALWDNTLEPARQDEIFRTGFFRNADRYSLMKGLKPGARAHLTLALREGHQPVQSGVDLMNAKLRMAHMGSPKSTKFDPSSQIDEAFYLTDCFLYVRLKQPLEFDSFFACEY